jgi:hypothetical protein
MAESYLEDDGYDLLHKFGETPWNDGIFPTHFEAPVHG